MYKENGSFKLGLDILQDLETKPRKKNPTAHLYKQPNGDVKFKAIIHEDVEGIKATRQSFKAVVTIVPIKKLPTRCPSLMFTVYISICSLLLSAFVASCYVTIPIVRNSLIAMHLVLLLLNILGIRQASKIYKAYKESENGRSNPNSICKSIRN